MEISPNLVRYLYVSLIYKEISDPEIRPRILNFLRELRLDVLKELEDLKEEFNSESDLGRFIADRIRLQLNKAQKIAIIVELRSSNPFQPHQIKIDPEKTVSALARFASEIRCGLSGRSLESDFKEAQKAFSASGNSTWFTKLAGAAMLGALLIPVVMTAGAAAPAITGLLALLGGGSIAAGGLGMVGGMVVLLVGGASGGAMLSQQKQLLRQLGVEGLRYELIKLEVTQRTFWRLNLEDAPSRRSIIDQQNNLLSSLKDLLEKEKSISDPNSQPIKDIISMIVLVEKSIERFRIITI